MRGSVAVVHERNAGVTLPREPAAARPRRLDDMLVDGWTVRVDGGRRARCTSTACCAAWSCRGLARDRVELRRAGLRFGTAVSVLTLLALAGVACAPALRSRPRAARPPRAPAALLCWTWRERDVRRRRDDPARPPRARDGARRAASAADAGRAPGRVRRLLRADRRARGAVRAAEPHRADRRARRLRAAQQAERATRRVRAMHRRVRGELRAPAGALPRRHAVRRRRPGAAAVDPRHARRLRH